MNINYIIIVSIVCTSVLLYSLYMYKTKEKFCGTCQGIGVKVYKDKQLTSQLYNEGKLTEFTTVSESPSQWQETTWDKFLRDVNKQTESDSS